LSKVLITIVFQDYNKKCNKKEGWTKSKLILSLNNSLINNWTLTLPQFLNVNIYK
jgi:hypothetical protein